MLSGILSENYNFLNNLSRIENRISTANQQITSGIRVSEASDDPGAVGAILDAQNEIDRITQIQTNLKAANSEATSADTALQAASNLLDQLTSIATQSLALTQTATTRAGLGERVQQIE